VSIKTEALSSGLGRTDSAWSSARHVSTTRVMMVSASPAPRRGAGGEEVAAQVEPKMAGDFWRSFMGSLLCCVSFAVFN